MYKFFGLLILTFISQDLLAQRIVVRRNDGSESVTESQNQSYAEQRLAIKTVPTSFFIGEFPLSAEYIVLNWLTLEAGIGVTTRNYLFDVLDGSDTYQGSEGVKAGTGFSYFGEIKIFFNEDAMDDDSYFGLIYHYRPWYTTYLSPAGSGIEDQSGKVVWTDFGITYGYQYRVNDHFIIESYFGLSIRSIESNSYYFYEYSGGWAMDESTSDESTLGGLFGIRIGFLP